jgi:hypothetical protein
MAYNPIGERINTVMPIVIIKITILKNQCSSMPINFFGKLILSKLLNETANEINVGIRINDQSHLMQTEKMMLAKMQQSDVIAILIICILLLLDLSLNTDPFFLRTNLHEQNCDLIYVKSFSICALS